MDLKRPGWWSRLPLMLVVLVSACTDATTGSTATPATTSTVSATTTSSTDVSDSEPSPPVVFEGPCSGHFAGSESSDPEALASEKMKVEFLGSDHPTGYTVSVHDDNGWYQVARVEPLARVVYDGSGGGPQTLDLSEAVLQLGGDAATVTASVTDPDGAVWDIEIDLHFGASPCVLETASSLTVDQDRQILVFASPVLDAGQGTFGTAKDTAVLGGLDWTVEGEESQAMAVTPDPLDVAWPMMAVSSEQHLIGLMWDPLQEWSAGERMPQPMFASPNWIDDEDSHLLGLGVPTAPTWVEESLIVDERDEVAKAAAAVPIVDRISRPYLLAAGDRLRVESSIVADYPAEIPEAMQLYVDRFGLPVPPPFQFESGLEAVIDSYLATAWDPASGSWYQGTFGPKAPYITVAAQLAAYADGAEPGRLEAAADTLTQAMGPQWQTSHDSGPSSAHMDFIDYGFRTGDVEEVLIWSAGSSAFSRGRQRPDGSWGYSESDNICPGALGEPGAAYLGTDVINASIILEHARITREAASVEAGLRALEHMDGFIKPAGAQVGEVPLVHGDPWAVAWAVRAYVEGYRISGDTHHLAKAREWAFKGIPFLYTWSHPDRPVMAYSSIAVMGTSCWTGSWAGIAVQWVGLDYAASLLELATVDDSYPWMDLVDGIARAATGMLDTRPQPSPGEWHEVVMTSTAPANTKGIGFSVRVNHELTIPGPTDFYVDDVTLVDLTTGENLIANGDFESGGLNDFPWFWDGDSVERASGSECRSGRCIHAVVAADGILGAGADVAVSPVPGRVYELRLWVKLADDPPPSSGPLFRVEYFLDLNEAKWVSIFVRPLTGFLPDAYDITDQFGYAPILPERLGDVLLPLRGEALHVSTLTVTGADSEYVISGLAEVSGAAVLDGGELRFLAEPRTGLVSHLAIVTGRPPVSVRIDGIILSTEDWRWVEETGLLFVTIRHANTTPVEVLLG